MLAAGRAGAQGGREVGEGGPVGVTQGYLSRVWQLSVLGIGLLIFKVAAGKGGEASGPARSGASTSTRESEIAKAL